MSNHPTDTYRTIDVLTEALANVLTIAPGPPLMSVPELAARTVHGLHAAGWDLTRCERAIQVTHLTDTPEAHCG